MTDPDETIGSPADRRFREELRRRLAEVDAETNTGTETSTTRSGTRSGPGVQAAAPRTSGTPERARDAADPGAATRSHRSASASSRLLAPATARRGDERSRTDRLLDWAPLVVGLLALAAIAGIVVYGMNGGDLGPW
ncbi:hypothetical protein [Frigoribacterium sp. Leaf172]|uniref:hypothetical protein n=1 Tax=Frigoribacterium sp. Leaf172 TaxID=1736285 RepID=UPI0006F87B6D|nr:hypothetical protein [Frigoribacterium sp. Leaf172]KQR65930.1 hypothetical protein ASF89_01800 [Frigoribacterium sp. Leaf172]